MSAPLLQVDDLSIRFPLGAGRQFAAVDGLSFSVEAGRTLAIVGESGCGKSISALALMRLLPASAQLGGKLLFEGQDLARLPEREMRRVRGARMSIIFQDPMAALNPVLTIGDQIVEAVQAHEPLGRAAARRRAIELLDLVRIPEPQQRLNDYPHRFSGGMRQRAAIAMALAASPALLIADEPTTALDVTIQAQILSLLHGLQRDLGMALILITHDLGVVAEIADEVLVMYAGRKVEHQEALGLFDAPRHPYTRSLMGARPRPGSHASRDRLQEIPGMVPAAGTQISGCAFAARCAFALPGCENEIPLLRHPQGAPGEARVACLRADETLVETA